MNDFYTVTKWENKCLMGGVSSYQKVAGVTPGTKLLKHIKKYIILTSQSKCYLLPITEYRAPYMGLTSSLV